MINSFNYSLFPSNEFFTFSNRAIIIAEPLRPLVPVLVPFIDSAISSKATYQAALERESKNPFTPLLAAKDAECDTSFMAFRLYVEACSYRTPRGWKAYAGKIMDVIDHYGWTAYKMGYKAQAAAETNMISDLKKNCISEIDLIKASEWFVEFETAKAALDKVLQQSIAEVPNGGPTIMETRPALVKDLKSLFLMIDLLASTNDAGEELKNAIPQLNELITTSLATVKASDTRAENLKKAETAKTPETK